MAKIVRLTESDLKRIIMRVLKEDSGPVETDSDPDSSLGKLSVKGGDLVFHRKDGQTCRYQVYKISNNPKEADMMIAQKPVKKRDKQYFEWMKFKPGFYDSYEVYFKNATGDHQNDIPKKLVNGLLSPGFSCTSEFDASLLGFGGALKKIA